MTIAERRERGTELCLRLTARVADLVPRGIGRWDETWRIVGPADAEFMAALTSWEVSPNPGDKERIRSAHDAVLAAWRYAVAEYEQAKAER